MERRKFATMLGLSLAFGVSARGGFRGAKYKVRRAGGRSAQQQGPPQNLQFEVSAEEPFPVRALDPVLHIGDYEVRDYRYGNMENTMLLFTCSEAEQLKDGAEVYLQYGNDERSRTSLPNYSRGMIE
ncbi:MAG: hypothetical protein HYZ37_18400 [Candidatus Solibacter usitatus]|nr:hypothetical protein [Candidatus Solibacter usitatus]